jgi:hypothetical protein
MTHRNFPGLLGSALLCASLSSSFTVVALGQTPSESVEPGAVPLERASDEPTAASEPTSEPPKPESDQAKEKAKDKPAAARNAADTRPPVAPPPKQEPAAAQVSSSLVVVEQLPGSAYLEPRTRGLRGGSLWLTMHGYEFPYMPAVSGKSGLRIGISGSAWVDTSYRKVNSGLAADGDANLHDWRQQGRFVGRITPTYSTSEGWFAQGQGEFVLNSASDTTVAMHAENTDDLFVRVGKWLLADITAGRFQGWEIYHFGMGLDLNTLERDGARTDRNQPPEIYGVTHVWDRMDGPGKLAAHFYPTDFLRFELLGVVGSYSNNQMGIRPVGILDLGWVKLKVGAEYEKQTPRAQSPNFQNKIENRGFGGSLQFVIDPYVEFGVNGAQGLTDNYNNSGVLDAGLSETRTSLGGFVNGRIYGSLLIGAGFNSTRQNNLKENATTGDNDVATHIQTFGAIQYALFESFYIKMVVAYADAHYNLLSDEAAQRQNYHNKSLSGRLRLMVLF